MEVAGQSFQSTGIQKERKEADQNAAFMALKALGLVPATIGFNTKASPGKLTIVMYTVAASPVGVFTESLILQMIFQSIKFLFLFFLFFLHIISIVYLLWSRSSQQTLLGFTGRAPVTLFDV